MRGRFITLEGGEGAGKSTQARLLALALEKAGIPVLLTREPGGAPGAERLRELLLAPDADWSLPAETLLVFAARAEHVARRIAPALATGTWVVCDRFSDSTMAYQGHALGGDRARIATLAAMMDVVPDVTLVLDVPLDIALARLQARGGGVADRYERLGADFFARVNAAFRVIAAENPDRCEIIAAAAPPGEIAATIADVLRRRFGIEVPA